MGGWNGGRGGLGGKDRGNWVQWKGVYIAGL